MQKPIYCFGIINLDVLVHPADDWPAPGELVHTSSVNFSPGGSALNTAISIKKLGHRNVHLLGYVGDDDAREIIENCLKKVGVDNHLITPCKNASTGICIVAIQSSGERSFLYSSGANENTYDYEQLIDKISENSIVHLGGVLDMSILSGKSLYRILELLNEKNCFISIDIAWDWRKHGLEGLSNSLEKINFITMNDKEAFALTGQKYYEKSADIIFNLGCPLVVIKLGENGAYLRSKNQKGIVRGYSVSTIDTTGAGDAFSGGFLYAMIKSFPVEEAIRFANAVGACCVREKGSTFGIKTYEETLEFMHSQKETNII